MTAGTGWFPVIFGSLAGFPFLTVALKASLLLLAAGTLNRLRPGTSASTRHLIWLFALVAILVTPVAVSVIPMPVEFPWLPELVFQTAPGAGIPPSAAGSQTAFSTSTPGQRTFITPLFGPRAELSWSLFPGSIYLLGVMLQLGFLAAGLCRLRFLSKRSLDSSRSVGLLTRRISSRLGIRRGVRVRLSAAVAMPAVWGLARPVVLLPLPFSGWSEACRRNVLAHELAHVARLDWASLLLGRLACIAYWPLPLVWWANRRMASEAEKACDDQVLALGGEAVEYARQLLELAPVEPLSYSSSASHFLRRSEIPGRIRAILDPVPARTQVKRSRYFATLALGLTVAATLGAVRPGQRVASLSLSRGGDLPPLMEAAWRGDLLEISRLVAAGEDPDRPHPGDGNALIAAARAGRASSVQLLLELGADPDSAVEGDGSALIAAAGRGDLEIVRLLIGAGADIDLAVPGEENALINAARRGHLEVARFLLESGARVDIQLADRERRFTALGEARRMGHADLVRLLRSYGARR